MKPAIAIMAKEGIMYLTNKCIHGQMAGLWQSLVYVSRGGGEN